MFQEEKTEDNEEMSCEEVSVRVVHHGVEQLLGGVRGVGPEDEGGDLLDRRGPGPGY